MTKMVPVQKPNKQSNIVRPVDSGHVELPVAPNVVGHERLRVGYVLAIQGERDGGDKRGRQAVVRVIRQMQKSIRNRVQVARQMLDLEIKVSKELRPTQLTTRKIKLSDEVLQPVVAGRS